MKDLCSISVIVPCYNSESFIKNCLNSLINQNFNKSFEIIIVDDASNDKTVEIIKSYNHSNIKLYFLEKNSGPSAARNLGLKKARGKYVFFLDVDDSISNNILSVLYDIADEKDCDMVFCDKKLIENSKNQRENTFYYPSSKFFYKSEITSELLKRFNNPFSYSGIFMHYGKLIRRSILTNNNIFFEEKLRYLEDEVFGWDTLAFVNSVAYVREQLYSYFVNPKVNTARSDAFNKEYPISNFQIIKNHIENSLRQRGLDTKNAEKISDHAFIYFVINSLVGYSMSIMLKKIDNKVGKKNLKNFIKELLSNLDVLKSVKNYSPSKNESQWIPRALILRSIFLIELACNQRCRAIFNKNRTS